MLLKKGCNKEGAKSKTSSKTLKNKEYFFQKMFQKTEYFKEKTKHRYKNRGKNVELKHGYVLDEARESVFLHEVTSVYSKYEENFSSTKPKISKQKMKSIAYLGRFLFFGCR